MTTTQALLLALAITFQVTPQQHPGWVQWWPTGQMPYSVRTNPGPTFIRPGEEGKFQLPVY